MQFEYAYHGMALELYSFALWKPAVEHWLDGANATTTAANARKLRLLFMMCMVVSPGSD